jgi:phage gp29-like protein
MPIDNPKDAGNLTRVRAETTGFKNQINSMLFSDIVTSTANQQMEGRFNSDVYDKILRDDQVSAGMMQRIASVVGSKYLVEKGGDDPEDLKAVEFIEKTLDHINWDEVTGKMLYSIFYGFTPAENIFTTDGTYIYLDAVKVRERDNFAFNYNEDMVFNPHFQDKEQICRSPYFWHTVFNSTNSVELYGRGLANALFYPVLFKHAGVQHWNDFLEGSANPKMVGTVGEFSGDEAKDDLLDIMEAMKGSAGAVLTDAQKLEVLESEKDGRQFDTMVDFHNKAISKTILGQSLTVEDGTSRSFGKTLLEIRQERAKSDARMVDEPFNRIVVKFLCDVNFPNAKTPTIKRDLEVKEDIETRSRADVRIFSTGARPTQDYITRTYGEGWILPPALVDPSNIEVDNRIVSHANGEVNVAKEGEEQENFSEKELDKQKEVDGTIKELTFDLNESMDDKVTKIMSYIDKNGIASAISNIPALLPDEEFDDVLDAIEQANLRVGALGLI